MMLPKLTKYIVLMFILTYENIELTPEHLFLSPSDHIRNEDRTPLFFVPFDDGHSNNEIRVDVLT